MTVQVVDGVASYTCPKCDKVSYNPHDVEQWYCGFCHTFASDVAKEYVTELDVSGISPENRPQRCDGFSCAILALFQCGDPSARLVHGYVRQTRRKLDDPEQYILHAWLEQAATGVYSDGSERPIRIVVDLTQIHRSARILPRDDYYRVAGVQEQLPIARFTRAQALMHAVRYGMDGPWESVSQPERS